MEHVTAAHIISLSHGDASIGVGCSHPWKECSNAAEGMGTGLCAVRAKSPQSMLIAAPAKRGLCPAETRDKTQSSQASSVSLFSVEAGDLMAKIATT